MSQHAASRPSAQEGGAGSAPSSAPQKGAQNASTGTEPAAPTGSAIATGTQEGPQSNRTRAHSRENQGRRNSYTKHSNYHPNTNPQSAGHHHNPNIGHANVGPQNSENSHFRGPRQGYPRYNHSRGPSYQGSPIFNPAMLDPALYQNMYPVFDAGRFMAQPPPFVPPQATGANRKVVMTDANGNPIDLREKLKHTRDNSSGIEKERTPEVKAPEVVKVKPNDAAQKMRELIAEKRKKLAEKEGKAEPKKQESAKPVSEAQPAAQSDAEPAQQPAQHASAETTTESAQSKASQVSPPTEPKAEQAVTPSITTAPEEGANASAEPPAEVRREVPQDQDRQEPAPADAAPTEAREPAAESGEATPSSTPAQKTEDAPKAESKPAPSAGKWVPPFLRRKMEAEAKEAEAKESGAKEPTTTEATDAPTPAAPEAVSKDVVKEGAKSEDKEAVTTEKKEVKVQEASAAPSKAVKEEPKEAAKEDPKETESSKAEKFRARAEASRHLKPEELGSMVYPSNALSNTEAGKGSGFRYTPDFLYQFAEKVPRAYYDTFRPVMGFDYEAGVTRWGSGRGGGMSSRGPSRSSSHVGFGPSSGRGSGGRNGGSMRGRNNSRRKGDRQGSRRDRDDAANIAAADLPPLHTVENAWTPSFVKKAEKNDEADDGRLSPEEVQRKVKSLLNKMAWENFDQIATQIRDIALQSVGENNAFTLRQVIQLTFDKAIDEPHWSEIYAAFFLYLHVGDGAIPAEVVDESDPNKVLKGVPVLRRYLLNMSQQEFEKGWGEIAKLSGNVTMLSDEYYAAIALKRRGLGLTQLIGELLKKGLVSEKLVMGCFARLAVEEPSEDIVESMSKLIRTVATTMIRMGQGNVIDMAMGTLVKWKDSGKMAARLRFKIMDMEDLARKKWVGVDDSNGPKTIAQVHLDALKKEQEAEREKAMKSRQGSRRGGDFGRSSSGRGRR